MTAILVASAFLVGASALAVLYVVGRQAVRAWVARRLVTQAHELEKVLRRLRQADYTGLDKMLFDMRDTYDIGVIEDQMRAELERSGQTVPAELLRGFQLLGLTDRYIDQIKNARSWQQRARAATVLGALGEVRAVKLMVAALRDPDEDTDVKLACAEALGRLRDPGIIPDLCDELGQVDEWSSPRLAQVLIAFGDLAVPPLLATLDSGALNARIWAAQILGKLRATAAIDSLIARLADRSDQMRLSAANALGDIGDRRAVRPLIDVVLRDPAPGVRAQAAAALGRTSDPTALPMLVTGLGDPEYWMRYRALEAIEALRPDDTQAIEAALRDSNPEVRKRAALALDRLGKLERPFQELASDDELVAEEARARLVAVGRAGLSERLVRHLGDENPRVRARVAALLGPVGDRAHAAELVKTLADPLPEVRLAAMAALGDLGAPQTAEALLPFLAQGESRERTAAADALVRFPAEELGRLLEPLRPLCTSESDELRHAVTRVIGVIPGDDATSQLADFLRDGSADVRHEALRALGHRGNQAVVAFVGQCLDDPSPQVAVAAADALGTIGGQSAVELLIAAMPKALPAQRESICSTLASLGFDAVQPVLDILMAAEDNNVRLGLVWTLGKTGDPRAVPLLALLLHERDARLRASVAGALGKIPCDSSAEALLAAVRDPSPFVRSAAVNSLGRVARAADVKALMACLNDPDQFVRNRAVLSLARIGGDEAFTAIDRISRDVVDPAFLTIALGVCGTPSGIGEAILSMSDPEVRRRVEELLGSEADDVRQRFLRNIRLDADLPGDGPVELQPSLLAQRYIETVQSSRDAVARQKAAAALAATQELSAQEALADALEHDPDSEVRRIAARGLLPHGHRGAARRALFAAVLDPEPAVRVVAIAAVGKHGRPGDTATLFDSLRSTSSEVVSAAEDALARIYAGPIEELHDWIMGHTSERVLTSGLRILTRLGDSRSLGLLRALIRDSVPETRIEAARALGALKDPAATRAMLDALTDPIWSVRAGVVAALAATTRADVIEALTPVCLDPSPEVRVQLARTLSTMTSTLAVELLERLASDHHVEVCARALVGLLGQADREAAGRFLGRWREINPAARRIVVQESGPVVQRLESVLAGALDPREREVAVKILAALGADTHAERIARALGDPDAKVRLEAVTALVSLEPERVGDWLRALQDDPVAEVRAMARRAFLRSV